MFLPSGEVPSVAEWHPRHLWACLSRALTRSDVSKAGHILTKAVDMKSRDTYWETLETSIQTPLHAVFTGKLNSSFALTGETHSP